MNAIDLHSHVIPSTIVDAVRRDPSRFGMKIEGRDGKLYFERRGQLSEMDREFYDVDAKLAAMDRMGLAVSALSVAPLAALDAIPGLTADEREAIGGRTARALLGEESSYAPK